MTLMSLSAVQLHEAAHVAAMHEVGVPVREVAAYPSGGHAVPAVSLDTLSDLDRAFICLAGEFGPHLRRLDGWASEEDVVIADLRFLTLRQRRYLDSRLNEWAFSRRGQIFHLADALAARPRLTAADLARMVHAPGSLLGEFAHLYPKPAPTPARRASVLTLHRVTVPGAFR